MLAGFAGALSGFSACRAGLIESLDGDIVRRRYWRLRQKNLAILRNYSRPEVDRRGNAFSGIDGADEDGVAPAMRTQFPAAQAGFPFSSLIS